jgi:hypothetical protein
MKGGGGWKIPCGKSTSAPPQKKLEKGRQIETTENESGARQSRKAEKEEAKKNKQKQEGATRH